MTIMDDPKSFLGSNTTVQGTEHVKLTLKAYIDRLAAKYLPKPLPTYAVRRATASKALHVAYEKALDRDETPSKELLARYRSKVGALNYASPNVRPDVAQAVGLLARALTFPTEELDLLADDIIVKLAHTSTEGLEFRKIPSPTLKAYSDSDWCVRHSTSGWLIYFGNVLVGHGSKRQQCIAMSSTEAEIIAASHAAVEIVYFRGLLNEMGVPQEQPTVLKVENTGAIELSKHRKSCNKSRHVDRRYLVL